MGQETEHPITTPKGAAALTVILAVIGVFAPFFTSLQAAQLFAFVAVLVIVWLYAQEARDCLVTRSGFMRLVTPLVSIFVICGVVYGANLIASSKPEPSPPAISATDISDAVKQAIKQNQKPAIPIAAEAPVKYNIVIKDVPSEPIRSAPIVREKPITAAEYFAKNKSFTVGLNAYSECISRKTNLTIGLYKFRVRAANYQNDFAYNKDDMEISRNLDKWLQNLKDFLRKIAISFQTIL